MAYRIIGIDHGSKEQLVKDCGAEVFIDSSLPLTFTTIWQPVSRVAPVALWLWIETSHTYSFLGEGLLTQKRLDSHQIRRQNDRGRSQESYGWTWCSRSDCLHSFEPCLCPSSRLLEIWWHFSLRWYARGRLGSNCQE